MSKYEQSSFSLFLAFLLLLRKQLGRRHVTKQSRAEQSKIPALTINYISAMPLEFITCLEALLKIQAMLEAGILLSKQYTFFPGILTKMKHWITEA